MEIATLIAPPGGTRMPALESYYFAGCRLTPAVCVRIGGIFASFIQQMSVTCSLLERERDAVVVI